MSIRIPPGSSVELELAIDEYGNVRSTRVRSTRQVGETQQIGDTATMHDPVGGPPLLVSSRLRPDPMAMYLLATAIIDATRALDQHTEAVERHDKLWRVFRLAVLVISALSTTVLLLDLARFLWWHVHFS